MATAAISPPRAVAGKACDHWIAPGWGVPASKAEGEGAASGPV